MGNTPCSSCDNCYRSTEIRIDSNSTKIPTSEIGKNKNKNRRIEQNDEKNSISLQKNSNSCRENEEIPDHIIPGNQIPQNFENHSINVQFDIGIS